MGKYGKYLEICYHVYDGFHDVEIHLLSCYVDGRIYAYLYATCAEQIGCPCKPSNIQVGKALHPGHVNGALPGAQYLMVVTSLTTMIKSIDQWFIYG